MSKLIEKFGRSVAMRTVRVRRSGYNTIITIPKEVLNAMHLENGVKVMMETDGEQIRISKVD